MSEKRVYVRRVEPADRAEFLSLIQSSRALHEPWIAPPLTARAFDLYLARTRQEDHAGLLVCLSSSDAIAGVINLNNIVRGSFLSASLGYYVGLSYSQRGYMTEGLELVKHVAFTKLGLHRLEANIQPSNLPSINLVKRCGFRREGLSPRYLYIDGAWRDHERWAICDTRDTLLPPSG